ncbi:LacI family DNA-binding transcriptional regulator [Enterococcus saccharolyticus]|uniref:LacI family DNA-binding transcriptional regulator n=1 Tax=Enterococcus TaxID=1350 RepID=UPI001E4AE1D3|nr:LacI family DNA-binding transcriptional regulator [Enterococcus saccharolyticus]MCD5002533.1 LacI family DNA-binding transcriptional regulator [Enterococcus saccharolyticus]
MKATMKEVAKLAGVGVGTVSRALNNGSIKESTRKKIDAAIKELNYQPDFYARGLKTNKTYTVALILPSVWHPFFSEFAFHVENYLEENNYKMFLCNSKEDITKEREYIQMVTQNKVDGIIGITYADIDEYISSNLPFVSIDRYFTEEVIYVTADNAAGGRLAVQELIKRGAKHLAYIGGYQETPNETKNRCEYFEIECKEQNIDYEILNVLEPITKDTWIQIEDFLKRHSEIDGIFTINDSLAVEVCQLLDKLGRNVPNEVQVIGFDGQQSREGEPYLVSTIVQPIEQMAKSAVELLLNVIQGKEVEKRTVLPVHFGEGWTTKSNI